MRGYSVIEVKMPSRIMSALSFHFGRIFFRHNQSNEMKACNDISFKSPVAAGEGEEGI